MAAPIRIIGKNKDELTNEHIQAQVRENGSLQVQEEGYVCSDVDKTDATYAYYGFTNMDGKWYIMRKTLGDPSAYRFAVGDSGYALAWLGKDSQDYNYYYVKF